MGGLLDHQYRGILHRIGTGVSRQHPGRLAQGLAQGLSHQQQHRHAPFPIEPSFVVDRRQSTFYGRSRRQCSNDERAIINGWKGQIDRRTSTCQWRLSGCHYRLQESRQG